MTDDQAKVLCRAMAACWFYQEGLSCLLRVESVRLVAQSSLVQLQMATEQFEACSEANGRMGIEAYVDYDAIPALKKWADKRWKDEWK